MFIGLERKHCGEMVDGPFILKGRLEKHMDGEILLNDGVASVTLSIRPEVRDFLKEVPSGAAVVVWGTDKEVHHFAGIGGRSPSIYRSRYAVT